MNTKHFAIVLLVAVVTIAASTNELAYGQSIQVTEGIEFTTEEVISIIIIGAFAGVIRAWQGYDKSPNEFDFVKICQWNQRFNPGINSSCFCICSWIARTNSSRICNDILYCIWRHIISTKSKTKIYSIQCNT